MMELMSPYRARITLGNNEIIFETGKMAKQANGAVFAVSGGCAVLATVCCSATTVEGLDFVPLSVDYNEKYYAAGKIPGGFLKREGRPRDKEILVSRLIDRPMRPLFNKKFGREIQVVPTTVSADQINPPDVLGMNAAFAAVYLSDIPFDGPIGAVRIAYLDGQYLVNPTFDEIERSQLEIVVAGSEHGITMVEGGGKEVSEEILIRAIEFAEPHIKALCALQKEMRQAVGKEKLPIPDTPEIRLEREEEIVEALMPPLSEACFVRGKFNRVEAIKRVKEEIRQRFKECIEGKEKRYDALVDELEQKIVRTSILERGIRTDGRGPKDIRPIACEIHTLPRTHGSALFTRGETQALAITTLGTTFDEQIMDDIDGDKRQTFMLHYNFPPFSVGEVGRLSTGRREIGHGHLAQRSLAGVLPSKEQFPYTIRVVSEILESNGSSSMATVCGGSLSLLAAGVPLKAQVAGIAMGLVTDGERYVVLSDILGEEDHLGDMDFKVAGTQKGITGFQMDIKIKNVSREIMTKALEQAREGRLHILEIMNRVIPSPAADISVYAPRILKYQIDPEKIGLVIGPAGKTIKGIAEESGAKIDIENDGTIIIFCNQMSGAELALSKIKALVEEPEVGAVYIGTVRRITDFGAFIEILPGKEGLCHISKMSKTRINNVAEVVREGQSVKVRLIEIDKMGRLNLSIVDVDDEVWEKSRLLLRR